MRLPIAMLASMALVLGAGSARGDDVLEVTRPSVAPAFVYGDDARLPDEGRVVGTSRVTLTSGGDAMRPFASDLAHPGAVLETGAELGLSRSLSFTMTGFSDGANGTQTASGATFALRVALLGDGPVRVVASFGALRDLAGRAGVFTRAAVAADVGRVRVSSTMHGEHLFDAMRDGLDVLVTAGVSYAVASTLRLGAEYVAQDVEGALDPSEKEGIRHFVGPTMGLELAPRTFVTAGPAFGLTAASPATVGRLALSVAF